MQLNAKVTDGKSIVQFRKDNDVRLIKRRGDSNSLNRMASVGAFLMDQGNTSFGKANRPQTPVKGIITGDYGQVAESYYAA